MQQEQGELLFWFSIQTCVFILVACGFKYYELISVYYLLIQFVYVTNHGGTRDGAHYSWFHVWQKLLFFLQTQEELQVEVSNICLYMWVCSCRCRCIVCSKSRYKNEKNIITLGRTLGMILKFFNAMYLVNLWFWNNGSVGVVRVKREGPN